MLRFTADSWKKTPVFFVFLKWTARVICEPGYDEMRSREISCTIRKTPRNEEAATNPQKIENWLISRVWKFYAPRCQYLPIHFWGTSILIQTHLSHNDTNESCEYDHIMIIWFLLSSPIAKKLMWSQHFGFLCISSCANSDSEGDSCRWLRHRGASAFDEEPTAPFGLKGGGVEQHENTWFVYIYIDLRWYIYIYICWNHWFILIYIDSNWYIMISFDLHWFTLVYIYIYIYWFTLI